MSFFNELKRRNVFKVAAAYIIVGWLIMQAGEVMRPALHLPGWVNSMLAFFLILGFPLALIFAWAFEMTPEGLKKEKDIDRSQSMVDVTSRKLNLTITVVLVLALALFAFDKFVLSAGRETTAVETALQEATQEASTKTGKSIAVLPFVNMSDDASNEFFADGISEEMLNLLAKIPELRVTSRSSAFSYKGKDFKIADVGRELDVTHVLEGSVRKAGYQVRITAQLIEVDGDTHLWSETYDRSLDDIFAIQDEIAAAVVAQLKIVLLDAVPVVQEWCAGSCRSRRCCNASPAAPAGGSWRWSAPRHPTGQ